MTLRPGKNIAIKVPDHLWDETLTYYRDRVRLSVVKEGKDNVAFDFGGMTLWIDRVPHQSRGDVWLELFTDDPDATLTELGSPQRDGLEPLGGVKGHWTSDPAGTVLLVRKP